MTSRTDTNASRLKKKAAVSDQPLRRILKDGSVPSIFPNAPAYLSTPTGPPRRTSKATPTSRREQQLLEMNILGESFRANDDISELSLIELSSRIQDETTAPSGFTVVIVGDLLFVYFLKIQTDNTPTIIASITVQNDFTIVVSVNAKVVPSSEYADLLKGKLRSMSQIINLMARVKAWTENIMPISFNSTIEMAIAFIEKGIEALDEDDEEHRKISFIIEQLHLLTKRKFGRQYSPQLTILSFLIHSASPAAYTVLLEEDILRFPSKSTLKKVTKTLNNHGALDNTNYLKLRVSKLNAFERTVLLIIDEIYIAKRVEYSGGAMQGLTSDGAVASTLLCFMVKSLASKYKDIVSIYPMCKLTAVKQNDCYLEVMKKCRIQCHRYLS